MNKYNKLVKKINKHIKDWDYYFVSGPDWETVKAARQLVKEELRSLLK